MPFINAIVGSKELASASAAKTETRPSWDTIANIEDLREIAKRRMPRTFFEYVEAGSYDELTLRANREALDALELRQRVMVDVSARIQETTIVGEPVSLPVALAPAGLTGAVYPNGEIHAARAAQSSGVPFCLSTMSVCSIEDVAAATGKPFWFQLYLMKDRGFSQSLIERAHAAQCPTLILTMDLHVEGQRTADVHNGLGIPPRMTLSNVMDIAMHPRWAFGMLGSKEYTFGNLKDAIKHSGNLGILSEWVKQQFDPSFDRHDVEWVRKLWPGKLIIKGILDPKDAEIAVAAGADAVLVSNHGGRQLDGAPSTVEAFPAVRDAVGDRAEILFDSGIRSGLDVLKALALGAQACLIGRAYLYGLGAGGEAGVSKALSLISEELDAGMALTGVTDVKTVQRDVIVH
ncbi:alpha-hydroxy acid oxidase [Microvirga puerhi]|uniref:Alpha-hydroxy-acid oxidizing protein n=1 Tax=Microvirga puerhi TaxID=2876078 RepID=A0ABS7VJC9_9HYPH|nr:alpha-hydroxy acid oxidase [Microvirga puerhi]MBZ6075621.1 alpha-hydroxy-acid oxidizing protein [Microvirga puerhi]